MGFFKFVLQIISRFFNLFFGFSGIYDMIKPWNCYKFLKNKITI
ncbi:hypothetical protein BLAHAN_04382 [Blautia hansenii DSM 20583]|uniref:Uncharacterized protein n=1 Tax=Blautia hansenii DSM 20583 TaxID=537007 RepID=C9L4T5_BLAHA|nr:hypothetical protein BLAHAN_04382 [Blautia hansenii DSM 20583]